MSVSSRRRVLAGALGFVVLCLVASPLLRPHKSDGDQASDLSVTLGWRPAHLPLPASVGRLPLVTGTKADLRHGEVLLNIWASSCGPCTHEMPWLQRFAERGKGAIRVVGLTRDHFPSYARAAVARARATYPNLIDRQAYAAEDLAAVAPLSAVPSTLLVKDGIVVWTHVGPFDSYAELEGSVLQRFAS